jgi:hypothetical protein
MSYFLLWFGPRRGEPRIVRYEDSDEAFKSLAVAEAEVHSIPGDGVVLLVARDEADLRETHSHYFESFDELTEAAQG